jgi:hypothetical protein
MYALETNSNDETGERPYIDSCESRRVAIAYHQWWPIVPLEK